MLKREQYLNQLIESKDLNLIKELYTVQENNYNESKRKNVSRTAI